MPTCRITAAPNSAGKTTFALEYLPKVALCRHFINVDLHQACHRYEKTPYRHPNLLRAGDR